MTMPTRIGLVLAGAVLLAAGAGSPLHAQFALKGGLNLTNMVGRDVAEGDSKMGLAFGGAFDVFVVGPLRIGPEVHYAQRGAENFTMVGEQPPMGPVELSLDYVEIPILVRFLLPFGGRRLTPYVMGGPVFGWQLSCSVTVGAGAGTGEPEPDCDDLLTREGLDEKLRDYEQGAMIGGGVALSLLRRTGAVTLEGRLMEGLSRLSDRRDGAELRNRSFTLLLGYSFRL